MNMSHEAYEESAPRRPGSRARVYEYLASRPDQWVPGPVLERVGGTEATRRVRELRKGGCDIECKRVDGVWSYRLRVLAA